nr:UvrD-helicase domain-containing protein [Chlamydiota bacterium]
MKGFDVLDPNLDLHQNHFLEASAGTGKTFAIENIVSRLIESGMDLERILIVTFTRAATSDLKMRIRRNIATKGLQEALFKFDQAKIFTIHSFCYHALREHALEADLSLEIEEEPATDIERELIKDYLRSLSTFSPFQLEKLLRKGIDHLVDQILRIAADRIPVHTGRSYDEIIQELRSLSCDHEQLFQHAHYYGKMCNKQKELKQDRIDALNDFVRFMQGEDVNIVDNPILLMNEQNRLKRAPEAYFPFLERAIPLVEELSDELGILAHLCQGASKKLEESDQMQFEDLLIKMDQKVDEPLFASKIAKQYDCVLIDEFQDTNPLQWRIFKKLFLNKLLYLVGDPKQAIYRFRHADIYTYMEARRCFEKCEVLNTNYRSTKSVVTKLNELFANFQFELPKTGETIAYQSVEYDASKEDEGGVFHLKAQKEEQLFAAI